MKLPARASSLIPHRNSMLLIHELQDATAGKGTAKACIEQDSIVVDSTGALLPLAFVELAAQAYAAVKGWEILCAGENFPLGYLVGVSKLGVHETAKVGDTLMVEVNTVGEFENFAVVEAIIRCNTVLLAETKIKLWVPTDEQVVPHD